MLAGQFRAKATLLLGEGVKATLFRYILHLIVDYFEYVKANDGVHFCSFSPEIPILDKFGPNNQNCHFKLKFGI